jgi:hypothetical protein
MKIYVAAVEALRKNERQGETQFSTEIDGFLHLILARYQFNLASLLIKLDIYRQSIGKSKKFPLFCKK